MNNNLLLKAVLVLVCLWGSSLAEDQGDWVDTARLPVGFLTHPFYAGYLSITQTKAFYYVYFQSENNPSRDPLLIRLSPGPGCSSLHNWLYTEGPFIFMRNSSDFRHNPFNWNQKANILFIEGPAGVGFSTSASATPFNDGQTVADYLKAILSFYIKFPETKNLNMHLLGNHYAGIIAPRLAKEIIEHNASPATPTWQKIRLRGMLLDGPCTMPDECDSHFEFSHETVKFMKNHYFISREFYHDYEEVCLNNVVDEKACQEVKLKMMAGFKKTGSDIRNVYKQCLNQGHQSLYPCQDLIGINGFLKSKDVKEDMHADDSAEWQFCNKTILEQYERDPRGSYYLYKDLLKDNSLKIWIVSGVLNGLVPTAGTKEWFQQLKEDLELPTLRLYEPWMFNKTINGGDVEELKGITLVTVRSAGYLIFQDQPELGFHVLSQFLNEAGTM